MIGLLSLYRLLVPLLLLTMQSFAGPAWGLVAERPTLFVGACIAYFTAAVLLIIARRLKWSSLRIVALVNAMAIDAIALGLILYAGGGVASGLGIPPGAAGPGTHGAAADRRDALLIAAVAALAVLVQQVFTGFSGAAPATDYTTAGLLGVFVFVVALATWPVGQPPAASEALARRQEIDLANLAQLSQYIVQHLRESILVIDAQDRIRLINESAAQILGDENAYSRCPDRRGLPPTPLSTGVAGAAQGTGLAPVHSRPRTRRLSPPTVRASIRATSRHWLPRTRGRS